MGLVWPKDLQAYVEQSHIPLRLACVNDKGWPIVLSLWYLLEDGVLYCATREGARVVQYLARNPRCGFEIASEQMPYCGVRGQAEARIIPDRGHEILNKLLIRYVGGLDNQLAEKLLKREEAEVALAIQPITLSSWNFERRMSASIDDTSTTSRRCPEGGQRITLGGS